MDITNGQIGIIGGSVDNVFQVEAMAPDSGIFAIFVPRSTEKAFQDHTAFLMKLQSMKHPHGAQSIENLLGFLLADQSK